MGGRSTRREPYGPTQVINEDEVTGIGQTADQRGQDYRNR